MKRVFPKPNIIISKCINFDNCRFNGDKVRDFYLEKLGEYVNYIPVCPEVAIGLGTPRMPLRIFRDENNSTRLFQPSSNTDLTEKINNFSQKFLKAQKNIDGFILKNRSPSCGIGDVKVYNKLDSHVSTERDGKGFFAQNIDEVFSKIPKEDEGRIKNFLLREVFLTKIFTLADFREIKKTNQISALSNFQAKNKYLFMLYSPTIQNDLGQIVASYGKSNLEEIFKNYYKKLLDLFDNEVEIGRVINSFTHIFGYFKNTCSSEEKLFFLETLEVYREGRIPTSSVINILKAWALRDKLEYILNQSILEPYPKELVELSDSGKLLKL